MGFPWILIFPAVALTVAYLFAPHAKKPYTRIAAWLVFTATATMFPAICFWWMMGPNPDIAHIAALITILVLGFSAGYVLLIDSQAEATRQWLGELRIKINDHMVEREQAAEELVRLDREDRRGMSLWRRWLG